MFGDKLIILIGMALIVYFGLKYINKYYHSNNQNEEVPEELQKRKNKKIEKLQKLKIKEDHLQEELKITDDLISVKNNVEKSEYKLHSLDEQLHKD